MNNRLVISAFFCFLLSFQIQATTYYVSNVGNDVNPGTMAQPFLTIQHATGLVVAGDTVYVKEGIYAGFDHRSASGTVSDPIVYFAESNATIIQSSGPIRSDGINIEGADYIVIDGFTVQNIPQPGNGIRVVLADHCQIKNCICNNNWNRGIFTGFTDDILIENNECMNTIDEHGIYVSNSSDRPIIRYNISHDNNNIGIHMNGDLSAGGDGIISDAQVYGNILYNNNQAAGLNMDGVENAIIYNNLIYNNHFAQGIALFQIDGAIPSRGALIYHNTIIVPNDGRWGILMVNGANEGTEIKNNIILNFHSFRGSITTDDATGLTSDYNILSDKMSNMGDGLSFPLADWQSLGLDQNSQVAEPWTQIFTDPSSDDYTLVSGSQAIDAGTNVSVTEDIEQQIRDLLPDIGAYETNSVLPIILESRLSSRISEESIVLSWKIKESIHTDQLLLQKYAHNGSWVTLAMFNSPGIHKNNYSVIDHAPIIGMNVYRLIEQTTNEKFKVVDINSIYYNEHSAIKLWPNPAKNKLNIGGQLDNITSIQIFNMRGQQIYKTISSISTINLPSLPSGTYVVKFTLTSGQILSKYLMIEK